MDCLYAKCIPIITDCVMAELEKLGQKYRIALRIARDERWERLQCGHKGTYADDCIVDRIMRHKIYIVATNDKDLKRRIRKIPGVPIMSVARGKYLIERLPGEFPYTLDCKANQRLGIVTVTSFIHWSCCFPRFPPLSLACVPRF
jgi:U3 small nucleolar RNA-associated protein 24